MQITLEQYEKIQHYLDGLMTPQDEHMFLVELSQDLSLKESFDFEKELRQNLSSIQNKKTLLSKDTNYYEAEKSVEDPGSIKSLIEKARNEWEEENKKPSGVTSVVIDSKPRPQKPKIFHIKPWVGIAAAACVIVAVASLVLFMPELSKSPPVAKTNDTLPAKKDTNPDVAKITPGDSTNINSEKKKIDPVASFKKYYAKDDANPPMPELLAMVPANYRKGDYSYNERLDLRNIPNTRGSTMDLNSRQNILELGHYYKGLSYIETNNNQRAVGNLQWVIDSAQNRQLKIKAQWYLGLVYLKQSNIKKALPLFSSLSGNSGDVEYRKRATEILETLKVQEQSK